MKYKFFVLAFVLSIAAASAYGANTLYENGSDTFTTVIMSSITTIGGSATMASNGSNGRDGGGPGSLNDGSGGSGANGGTNPAGFGSGGNGGNGGNGGSGGAGAATLRGGGGGGQGGGGGAGGLGGVYMFSNSTANFMRDAIFTGNTVLGADGSYGGSGGSGGGGSGVPVSQYGSPGLPGTSGTKGGSTGGAISSYNSDLNFYGNRTEFLSNTAGYGGAISVSGGKIEFASNDTSFKDNLGTASGGAIAAVNTDFYFSGNSVFEGNLTVGTSDGANSWGGGGNGGNGGSGGRGGANGQNGSSGLTGAQGQEGLPGTSGLTALGLGGAILAYNSAMNFSSGTVIFKGNEAFLQGGALYMQNSTVTFNTDGGTVLFTENKANNNPNDVYMSTGAILNISGSNSIRFEGGILSHANGTGIAINKSGSGAMYLGGVNEIYGAFNITGGGDIILLADATYKGIDLKLGNTPGNMSVLDMHNGTINKVELSGNFESNNNLRMDIFASGNDEIKAGIANIDGNIDIFVGVGTYNNKEFELIITSGPGNLTGEFSTSWISDNGLSYQLKYDGEIVKLIVNGIGGVNFQTLSSLTYNQKETEKTFVKISAKNFLAWEILLSSMRDKQNAGETEEVKNFLSQTSGYFLANVIRNMAADSPNNELYDKIRNYNEEYGINSGLWVQIKGGIESFKSDENSPEDYRDTSIGVMFGLDWFAEESLALGDVMWGVYGRINKNTIEQGSHKAYGNKNGLGVYGGYIKEEWELKGMLLGSFDRFSTERAVMGETAEADINAVTISADAEAALKIELNEVIKFKPYFGIELANTMYGGFKEKGAGIYNLDVNGGSYLRSAARVGAGLNYEKEIWIWYANVEGKYKIEGTKPEIESAFENTGVSFNSRGSEEGRVEAGIGIGAEVRVASDWKIFANGKYYTGERYENLYGNIGMRYMFGKTLESPKETLSKEKPANKEKLTKESVEKNRLVKNDSVLPQQNFVSSDNEKESFSKKTNNKDKSARKEFNKAKRLYNKGEYLRATDMLSEIIASYPDFKLPVQLYAKIQDDMNNTADSREEPDFSKITYAKGYCSYYKEEYNNALTEWDKYILFAGKNKELLEYIDKVKNLLNFKDFVNREAELDAKANEMLNEGIKKYKAARWMLCIRDMETLQKFVTENKFSGTDEYYIRAKEYIDLSVNELAKTIKKAEKKEDKKPDPQDVEKKPEIDEAASDQKYNEGLTQYAQGKYLEAERTWELTLRLNPNHQKAKIALSRLRSSGHLAE